MHFLRKVRLLPAWSRALLVGFVVAFGLNSIAHASHQHEPASPTTSLHSTACGYCLTFDHLESAPAHVAALAARSIDTFVVAREIEPSRAVRPRSTAQPRAPPAPIET